MILTLIFLMVFFLFTIVFLLAQKAIIKQKYSENEKRLQVVIFSLREKQQSLNVKIDIMENYKKSYSANLKIIGLEIVELQKVFVTLISKENYS